jgi:hypothetical protein
MPKGGMHVMHISFNESTLLRMLRVILFSKNKISVLSSASGNIMSKCRFTKNTVGQSLSFIKETLVALAMMRQ